MDIVGLRTVGADPCVCPAEQKTWPRTADSGRTHGFAPTVAGIRVKKRT